MNALVLGAGHVGREIVKLWVRAGHRTSATTRGGAHASEIAALGAEPIAFDVTRDGALPACDIAVWCVGHDRSASPDIRTVYVGGLARTLAILRCERLLYTSSTGVYGAGDVDESSPLAPEDGGGAATADAEAVLRRARPDAIVLRLAGLYGRGRVIGRGQMTKWSALDLAPERWLNLVHHEDAAAAVALAGEKSAPGALYNVTDGHPVTRRAYYTLLARLLDRPAPQFGPDGPAGGRRVSIARIVEELGYAPRWALEAGLRDAIGA